jgi:SOS-response transcriptional repressor LexA
VKPRDVDSETLKMLGEKLRTLREERGRVQGRKIYQRDVAKLLRIKEETYRSYEYGRAQLPEDKAKALGAEWGVQWQEFYKVTGLKPSTASEIGAYYTPEPELLPEIPFVGNVGANTKVEWMDPTEIEETIPVPQEMATARGPKSLRFACRIVGDSCYDLLWPGDLCVFHKEIVPKIGKMVFYKSPENKVTVKQLKHDGSDYVLHPLNPKYEDEVDEGGEQIGYLVGIVRIHGSKKVTVYDETGIVP